jgi:hypothetical protein
MLQQACRIPQQQCIDYQACQWFVDAAASPSASAAAIRALRESGRRVGMSAAGILSSCNPVDAGYLPMWAAAANGSWLGVLPGAGRISGAARLVQPQLCVCGTPNTTDHST